MVTKLLLELEEVRQVTAVDILLVVLVWQFITLLRYYLDHGPTILKVKYMEKSVQYMRVVEIRISRQVGTSVNAGVGRLFLL